MDLAHGRDNGFLAKFSPDGSKLMWASYLGSGDDVRDIKVDPATGNVYTLSDFSSGFNNTPPPAAWFANGLQKSPPAKNPSGGSEALVVEISSDGSRVLAGTYISGSGNEFAGTGALALDATGVYVGFGTTSTNMPVYNAYQSTNGGGQDFYVAKLSRDLSGLVYGTYIGGSGSDAAQTHEIALDAQGDIYVALYTNSPNLPTTPGRVQNPVPNHQRQHAG